MINLLNITQCTERFKEVVKPQFDIKVEIDFQVSLDPEVIYPDFPTKHISFSKIVAAVNFDSLAGGLLESLLALSAYPFAVLEEVAVDSMIGGLVITYQFEVYEDVEKV